MKQKNMRSPILAFILVITLMLGNISVANGASKKISDWFPGTDQVLAKAVAESLDMNVDSEVTVDQLNDVTYLYITYEDGPSTVDIGGISELKNLSTFSLLPIKKTEIKNADELKTLSALTDLSLGGQTINSGHFIKDMTQLSNFTLAHSTIEDDTLGTLTGVSSLALENIDQIDIDHLYALRNQISYLNIFRSDKIDSFEKLKDFPNVQSLNIYLAPLTTSNMETIGEMNSLMVLNLNENKLEDADYAPIANLKALYYLAISGSKLETLTPFKDLENLQHLILDFNEIKDLTPLSNYPKLEYLSLDGNTVSDLTPIKTLTNLETLVVGRNQIKDLTPVSSLKKLKTINFFSNEISDLTPLSDLSDLNSIYGQQNKIQDLSPLKNMDKLQDLALDNNQIYDISPIGDLFSSSQGYVSAAEQWTTLETEDKSGDKITVDNIVVGADGKPVKIKDSDVFYEGNYNDDDNTVNFTNFKDDMFTYYQFSSEDGRFSGSVSQNFQKLFVVTFDAQGGTSEKETVKVRSNSPLEKPADPVWKGKTFKGWNSTEKGDGSNWNFKSDRVTSDMTLYGQWRTGEDSEGGTGQTSDDPNKDNNKGGGNDSGKSKPSAKGTNGAAQTGDESVLPIFLVLGVLALMTLAGVSVPAIRTRFADRQ